MGGGASRSTVTPQSHPALQEEIDKLKQRCKELETKLGHEAPEANVSKKAAQPTTPVHRQAWAEQGSELKRAPSDKAQVGFHLDQPDTSAGLKEASTHSPAPVLVVSAGEKGSASHVMAADVGGTNSRFMLYDVDANEKVVLRQLPPGKLLYVRKYSNIEFSCFADVVEAFLEDCSGELDVPQIKPEVACLAVAGVAQQNRCRLTNLDWLIDGPALAERFGIGYVEVINDFVAQGYGVLTLNDSEVIQLAGPAPVPGAPVACVGAGTGLGQCFLTAAPTGEYQAFPSEGGHAEFAPRGAGNDETQLELLKYLKVKFSGWNRISFERVVSGKGICNVYEFLAYKNPTLIDKKVHEDFLVHRQDAGIVAKNAVEGSLCQQALRIFAECYGAVCGTFALQVMPFGGLYLSGGVTQKLQGFLQQDPAFMEAYFDKGRVSPMLKDVPLFFVKGDEMGQRGAHLRAVRLLHMRRHDLHLPAAPKADAQVHLAPPRDAAFAELLRQTPKRRSTKPSPGDLPTVAMAAAPVKASSPR